MGSALVFERIAIVQMSAEDWRTNSELNCVLDGYLWIRKSSVEPEQLAQWREELAVQSATNNFITGKPTARFEVQREDDTWFGVPLCYQHTSLPRPQQTVVHSGIPLSLTFGGDFVDFRTDYDQADVIKQVQSALLTRGAGLLCLDTGMGKTLIALYLIAALRVKTLVVVHKKDSIVQFTKQAMRFLPGVRVGLMRASIKKTKDMDIVITTVQSLSKGKYSAELLNEFGFVVADEIHLMVAEVFHLAFTYLRCRYRLGLTATPNRRDGLGIVIEWFFGPPVVTLQQPRNDVAVRALHYKAGVQTPLWIGSPANRKPNYTGMVSRLVKDKWRNQLCVSEIIELAINTTGQTLVISERKAHVQDLFNLITEQAPRRWEENQVIMQFLSQGFLDKNCVLSLLDPNCLASIEQASRIARPLQVAQMTGDGSDEQRQVAKLADIVIATRDLAKDTLDLPNLTRLVVTTPISKNIVQQLRGRLLRRSEQETKERGQDLVLSHVFDEWENPGMFAGMYWGCNRYYKDEGYKIRHFTYDAERMEELFPIAN